MSEIPCERTSQCHHWWGLLREGEVTSAETHELLAEMPAADANPPLPKTDEHLATAAGVEFKHYADGEPEGNPWDAVVAYNTRELRAACSLPIFQRGLCGIECPLLGITPPEE